MNIDHEKQSTEQQKPIEENLVKDLKESLNETINETKDILLDLEQTVETTIKDQSMSYETKKIVDSISNEINNSEEE